MLVVLSVCPIKAKNVKIRAIVKTDTGDTIACNAANRYLLKEMKATKNLYHGVINIDFRIRDSINFSTLDASFLVIFFDCKNRFLYEMITPKIKEMSNIGRWCGVTLKVDVAILKTVKYIKIGIVPRIVIN